MATNFVQRMMIEHSELEERIKQLNDYVYSKKSDKDDKIEFTNKCIQLSAMRTYEKALRARLENQDIICEDGQYFAHLAKPCVHHSGYSSDECEMRHEDDCQVRCDEGNITDRIIRE